jgi:cytochrome P450
MTQAQTEAAPMPMARGCPFDPPERYRELRAEDPVSRLLLPSGDVGWLVTRFADVREVLADNRFSHRNDRIEPTVPPEQTAEWVPTPPEPGAFNMMDPPEQTRYRRLLAKYFSVRRIRGHAGMIEEIASELLDRMVATGPPADLVADYTVPLTSRTICVMLGIREDDRPALQEHINNVFAITVTPEQAYPAIMGIGEAMQRLVTECQRSPGADIVSDLLARGDLTVDEVRTIAGVLATGGMDTTANMMALGALTLLRHPDELDKLREDPALFEFSVDELLRFLTISQWGAVRRALSDVEIGGQLIREGELVVVALNSANRDERHFDEPDRLDISRRPPGHVAFGFGPHQCIGQNLARTSLSIGWRALFTRLSDLRVSVPLEDLSMRHDMTHYGLHALPVHWQT